MALLPVAFVGSFFIPTGRDWERAASGSVFCARRFWACARTGFRWDAWDAWDGFAFYTRVGMVRSTTEARSAQRGFPRPRGEGPNGTHGTHGTDLFFPCVERGRPIDRFMLLVGSHCLRCPGASAPHCLPIHGAYVCAVLCSPPWMSPAHDAHPICPPSATTSGAGNSRCTGTSRAAKL